MIISKRKDEHIKFANEEEVETNDFDKIILEHNSLPNLNYQEINLESDFLGFKSNYPFYINAMTGGSQKALEINKKLALIAKHFNIPIVLGSQSAAFKDPKLIETYKIVRDNYETGIIVANVSANATLEQAIKAVEMVNANALSIHINVVQELVMDEGDRDFSKWQSNIKTIVDNLTVPVIVKEVGFGMSKEVIERLKSLGVKYIDVSGKGGTNFARIERKRSVNNDFIFEDVGISTVNSLLNGKDIDITLHASGGIRNALDIYKAIKLGAKNVGLSQYFLKLTNLELNEAIKEVEKLIDNLIKCYIIFE